MKKHYLLIYLFAAFSFTIWAQPTVVTIGVINSPNPTTVGTQADIIAVGLTRGSGLDASGTDGTGPYSSRDINSNDLNSAIANFDYVQFSAGPVSDYSLSINRLRLRMSRLASGSVQFAILYSFDGFATAGTQLIASQSMAAAQTDYIFTVANFIGGSAITAPPGEDITLRLYVWGAQSNGVNSTFTISTNSAWSAYGVLQPGVTIGGSSTFDGYIYSDGAWEFNGAVMAPDENSGAENAIVRNGTTAFTSDVALNNLTIDEFANLNIFAIGSLILNGNLDVQGNLTLRSTSTRYASIIPSGTVTTNGIDPAAIIYQRHAETPPTNDLLAPPLSGADFATFAGANLNLVDNPNNISEKLFGPFDKGSAEYLTWDTTVNGGEVLTAGVGYRTATTNDGTLDFFGDIITSPVSVNIVNAGPRFAEWNLIGNPYPSYFSLDEFLALNNSQFLPDCAGIYGYDGNASDGWTIWNLAYSEANPNAVVTPGQGFIVASQEGGGTINFTPEMRSIGSTDDFILGRTELTRYLQLSLSSDTKKYNTEFYFSPNATKGMDVGYDAAVYNFVAPNFALYSELVEENAGYDMAIQSINNKDIEKTILPLGVNAEKGKQLTISIANSTFETSAKVYLEDRLTNSVTLLNDQDYIFTPNVDLNGTGRFYLNVSQQTLSAGEASFENLKVFYSNESNSIQLRGILKENTKADLFDIQGRKVRTNLLEIGSSSHSIDATGLSKGVYLLNLTNKSEKNVSKVIVR